MHELAFADAVRPLPVVCLKLPLTDYSLGHEVLLLRSRNPLVAHDDPQEFDRLPYEKQRAALIQAVDVCSQTWAENNAVHRSWLNRWRFRRVWKTWNRAIARAEKEPSSEETGKKSSQPEISALIRVYWMIQIAEFRNYLAASKSLPPPPTPEASSIEREMRGEKDDATGRMSGSPLLASLYHFVNAEFTFPTSEYANALDFPYSRAAWLYFVALEAEGRMRIESFKEREIALEMEENRAFALQEELETAPKTAGLATFPPDLSVLDDMEDQCQP